MEYALFAVFIAVAAVVGITLLGSAVDHLFHLGDHAIQPRTCMCC